MWNFVVITVPTDVQAPLGARTSAGTVMTWLKFLICTRLVLEMMFKNQFWLSVITGNFFNRFWQTMQAKQIEIEQTPYELSTIWPKCLERQDFSLSTDLNLAPTAVIC